MDDRDLETLLSMQGEDGAWSNSWFYKYGASGIFIKNDGVTTALAIRAIQQVRVLRKTKVKSTSLFSSVITQFVAAIGVIRMS